MARERSKPLAHAFSVSRFVIGCSGSSGSRLAEERSGLNAGDRLLIVGTTGGVGQFLTQLASQNGLQVIATGTPADASTLKALGASFVVDFTLGSASRQVRRQFPEGIEGLADLVNGRAGFTDYSDLVHAGGVALSANFVADEKSLALRDVRGGNFTLVFWGPTARVTL